MKTIIKIFTTCIFLIQLSLFSSSVFAANYPLEIIQPQAGLDVNNRFYKAYPGLEYNVRLAVIGGTYPFTYEILSGPSEMIINKSTGEISWPNPVINSTPYSVEAKVVDSDNTETTVKWTITVTSNGFKFIDAINGRSRSAGGTGAINNPWKSFADMYEGNDYDSKYATSYAGEFLYFRSGTYAMDAWRENGGRSVPIVDYNKPLVWLAYPGDTMPQLDMGMGFIELYSGANNFYLDGFEITNITNTAHKGFQIESSASNVTFRRNIFHNLTASPGSHNQSAIMIAAGAKGNYWSFQDNEFYDLDHGYGILGYVSNKVLVENNTLHDIRDSTSEGHFHSIGPKESTTNWFIRANTIYNVDGNGIWIYYSDTRGLTGDIEVSFNNVEASVYPFVLNYAMVDGGEVFVFRNTFIGGRVRIYDVNNNTGPFHLNNNVIVNNTLEANGITCSSCSDLTRLINTNNLHNTNRTALLNNDNSLTDENSAYHGTHGHVIDMGKRPKPPQHLRIQ